MISQLNANMPGTQCGPVDSKIRYLVWIEFLAEKFMRKAGHVGPLSVLSYFRVGSSSVGLGMGCSLWATMA